MRQQATLTLLRLHWAIDKWMEHMEPNKSEFLLSGFVSSFIHMYKHGVDLHCSSVNRILPVFLTLVRFCLDSDKIILCQSERPTSLNNFKNSER